MSKKKNKNKAVDIFDISVEEQKANAELFHDVEMGEASILDALNLKVKHAPVSQSEYTRQIAEACFGIKSASDEDVVENNYIDSINEAMNQTNVEACDDVINEVIDEIIAIEANDNVGEQVTTIVEETITHTETVVSVKEPEYVENDESKIEAPIDIIPRIRFRYNHSIGKMFVDDGWVATPISVCHSKTIELDEDMIPDGGDAYASLLSKIFFFIITTKHPSVIMSEESFNIKFGVFSKINFSRFIFFKNAGFVYVYVVEPEEIVNFYSVSEVFNMDNTELLRYCVATAYACNTVHNSFMYYDEDEVDSVMEDRHAIKELMDLIDTDEKTEYAGHNVSGDVISRMQVKDLLSFVSDTHNTLDELLDEIEDDDDDEDDDDIDDTDEDDDNDDESDDSYDEDDVNVNDFPDIDDLTTGTDDIDQKMEEEEPIETIISKVEASVTRTVTNNSNNDMILPIVRRR